MKTFLKRLTPSCLINIYHYVKLRERRICCGNLNPDKTFYIIGFDDEIGGVFWLVNKVLMHIAYAEDNNFIPVVDFKNYSTQYTGADEIGKVNIWEKFFAQPSGFTLDEALHSKNVIMCKKAAFPRKQYEMGHFYDNKTRIEYFRGIFKKYITFSDSVNSFLVESEKILVDRGKLLGVLCRGTDYITTTPKNHPVPPSASQVIDKAKEVMGLQHCDSIFLATEDEDVYREFRNVFGEKLIVNPQKRISKKQMASGEPLSYTKMKMNINSDERYQSGLDYLDAIYLLSKCDCFVGVRCGGSKGALLLTDGFEYEYTFNLGIY